jgi:hypothetical protein
MTGFLRPLVRTGTLGKPAMEDGMFRNPPVYTALGGFTSSSKWTDPAGRRMGIGGPTALKGKPV